MKNSAKFWRNVSLIFVLPFSGKLAARNFTQIPPHIRTSNSTRLNQNSFTAILWELVGPTKVTDQAQKADVQRKLKTFADSLLLPGFKHLEGARNPGKCRSLQQTEDCRRKPQIGVCHLRSVILSAAPIRVCRFIT